MLKKLLGGRVWVFFDLMKPIRNSWCTTFISDNERNMAVLQRSRLCLLG